MSSDTQQQAWPGDAAGIVALPGDTGDGSAAGALRTLLLSGQAGWRAGEILDEPDPRKRIPAWAEFLERHADRDDYLLFAYFPARVLSGLPDEITDYYRWSTLVELYEAWSELICAGRFTVVDERSRRIGGAYLARTRWLLLSLPFRPGWEGRIPALSLARVDDGSGRIVTLARQARGDWLATLGQIDDYPQLKQDIAVEDEARVIAVLPITRQRLAAANPELNLEVSPPGAAAADRAGAEVTGYVISRLLLPLFALGQVWRIVYGSAGWGPRLTGGAAIAVCLTAMALLTAGFIRPASGLLTWAALAAIAWYVIIAVGGAADPATAWPWLLRQPASAAVGLLALVFAPPDWWHDSGRAWHVALWAVLLLAGTGLGYLYFEAGGQDVRGPRRAWRPPLVAAFGYLHAVMVSVIGLRFLLPEFAPRPLSAPRQLSCWWQAPGCGPDALPGWLIVLAAASWSFAAAVFLQIIWDDQPVTAPIAHVSWHRGG